MKKDIYVIRNTVNKKVYVGQSNNPKERFAQHKKSVYTKGQYKSALSEAMGQLGVENFYMEVLETGAENPGEREEYWITLLDSMEPNGYNKAHGCNGPDHGVNCKNSTINSEEDLSEIKNLLKNSTMTFTAIGEKFGIGRPVVSLINLGNTFFDSSDKYPLRDTSKERRRLEEQSKQLHYALKYEKDKSIKQISEEYGVAYGVIESINRGDYGRIPGNTYPLRKGRVPMEYASFVPDIKFMLKHEASKTMKDIARECNVSYKLVYNINCGAQFFDENEDYPIRQGTGSYSDSGRTCLDMGEIKEIENLLHTTGMSMRAIGEKFGVSQALVGNINRGVILKYRRAGVKYPLRDNRHKHSK